MPPDESVALVRYAARRHLSPGSPVLVACSGGADSIALAAAVAFEAPKRGVAAGLVTVDHGLQPGSRAVAERAAQLGYELGLDPVELVSVDIGTAGGPEAAARRARYEALDGIAEALDADVWLGHTLDDQAETVLLGLGRGSGPRSIAGMRERAGRYVRPLLRLRRATTRAACAALGLEAWDDPHNDDPRFQRVRLRHEVLPLLEDVLQGGVAESLARTAGQVQDLLDAVADTGPPHGETVPVDRLAALPRALRTDALRGWASARGAAEVTATHVAALDALVTAWHGQGPIDLPGGVKVRRVSGTLVAERAQQPRE